MCAVSHIFKQSCIASLVDDVWQRREAAARLAANRCGAESAKLVSCMQRIYFLLQASAELSQPSDGHKRVASNEWHEGPAQAYCSTSVSIRGPEVVAALTPCQPRHATHITTGAWSQENDFLQAALSTIRLYTQTSKLRALEVHIAEVLT